MSEDPSSGTPGSGNRPTDRTGRSTPWPDLRGILEDRNDDGIHDYINARFYVGSTVTAEELASAANLAARLAFETLSLDLPLAFPVDQFTDTDPSVAIIVGRAALAWHRSDEGICDTRAGSRRVLAIAAARDANLWAEHLAVADYGTPSADRPTERTGPGVSIAPKSLSELFTTRGLLHQSDGRIAPDSLNTIISIGPDVRSPAVIDLAARLALETTGLTLPLAYASDAAPRHHNPILIGATHPRLRGRVTGPEPLKAGEGQVQLIAPTQADGGGVAIRGGDATGETAAIRYVADRLPYADRYGPGNLELGDIESDLQRFLSIRSAEGQLSAGLSRVRRRFAQPPPGTPSDIGNVIVTVNGSDPSLDHYATASGTGRTTVRDNRVYQTFFEETLDLPWEVDIARGLLETALPYLEPGSSVDVDLRISEPAAVRQALAEEIESIMLSAGARPEATEVRVLSAFKQGYSWIDQALKPLLAPAASIRIHAREIAPGTLGLLDSPARWLQELYPIDEVLARDLGLETSAIELGLTRAGPTYRLIARDRAGTVCVDEAFEPSFVTQPVFEDFPDYARAYVSTGWIRVTVDGVPRLDHRVPTDPERVWTAVQQQGLRRLGAYLSGLYDSPPTDDDAPHFGVFEVDVEMSEPDERIGIDEERISTPEALHEDIYFNSILFTQIFAQQQFKSRLRYPGRVIPRVRGKNAGGGPRIHLRLTGKPRAGPVVEAGSTPDPTAWSSQLRPLETCRPVIDRATVRDGRHDVTLGIRVLPAADGARQDRSTEIADMLSTLGEMRSRGGATRSLNYRGIGRLDIAWHDTRIALAQLPDSAYARPRPNGALPDSNPTTHATVALDSRQTSAHIARLATLPEVCAFYAGVSFLGTPVWALAVTSAVPGRYVSQPRMSVTKPVLFLTGRQHGNEVSSTSHILQLVEWLAREPQGRRLLARVNLIVQPMTNPDGADLAVDLARSTPDYVLHAGYTGCLGVDVTEDQWSEDSVYPESRIRRTLWEIWRPDVVLDPHGYPSHEWVQLFGGHAAWFRSRDEIRRDWWIPRGAFIPHFEVVRDPRFPAHEATACAIRDRLASALVRSMGDVNQRMYARYRKYSEACGIPVRCETHQGLWVYPTGAVGRKPTAPSASFMLRHPEVTVFQTAIELPDETARGSWLRRLVGAGFEASLACVRFLADSGFEVTRSRREDAGSVTFEITRQRPVRPG